MPSASGKVFNVTTSDFSGPGSLLQAVADANDHLGHDTIQFNPGLAIELDIFGFVNANLDTRLPPYKLFDSVTIDGAGSKVFSQPLWIDRGGGSTSLALFFHHRPSSTPVHLDF